LAVLEADPCDAVVGSGTLDTFADFFAALMTHAVYHPHRSWPARMMVMAQKTAEPPRGYWTTAPAPVGFSRLSHPKLANRHDVNPIISKRQLFQKKVAPPRKIASLGEQFL
jgi:hypothetical protein